ncbi:hypothetical protein ATANTOWER_029724 [Ataeniobius toweri]|uniref:Uncharacterized protein n=1 Tax=Ataeniobius toweri TaxID=208326 RepID=A0ABU7AC96_9TELE|nr:hypothetical protein [Ataeniobius toweri]
MHSQTQKALCVVHQPSHNAFVNKGQTNVVKKYEMNCYIQLQPSSRISSRMTTQTAIRQLVPQHQKQNHKTIFLPQAVKMLNSCQDYVLITTLIKYLYLFCV